MSASTGDSWRDAAAPDGSLPASVRPPPVLGLSGGSRKSTGDHPCPAPDFYGRHPWPVNGCGLLGALSQRQHGPTDRFGQRRPGGKDAGQIGVKRKRGRKRQCLLAGSAVDDTTLENCIGGLQIRHSPVRIREGPLLISQAHVNKQMLASYRRQRLSTL